MNLRNQQNVIRLRINQIKDRDLKKKKELWVDKQEQNWKKMKMKSQL